MTGISCDSYVPFDYDKDISAASETVVDFEYRITNFDVVDTEDYVSLFKVLNDFDLNLELVLHM